MFDLLQERAKNNMFLYIKVTQVPLRVSYKVSWFISLSYIYLSHLFAATKSNHYRTIIDEVVNNM